MTALSEARFKQGLLLGEMRRLGFALQKQAEVEAVTEEVVKSSEIEGESLDWSSVRSSVGRRLGVAHGGWRMDAQQRKADSVVEMTLDATLAYAVPLTGERLVRWHAALFPSGYSGLHAVRVGDWRDDRDGPM